MNPECLIAVNHIFITQSDYQIIGKNKDTLKFEKNGITYIKFHAKALIEKLSEFPEMELTVVGKPSINEWMGNQTPQIIISDIEIGDSKYSF